MISCTHPEADAYVLIAAGVSVRFCQFDDCHEWLIRHHDSGTAERGHGLDDYQTAIAYLAREQPEWTGAAGLYTLMGHAPEVLIP